MNKWMCIATTIVLASVLATFPGCGGDSSESASNEDLPVPALPGSNGAQPAQRGVVPVAFEPDVADFGEVPALLTETMKVTVRNTSDQPVTIVRAQSNCGCTVARLPEGQELLPGEATEFDVSLSGTKGGDGTRISQNVTLQLGGNHPPATLPVRGVVRQFVTMEPAQLDPEQQDGRIVLRSTDGEPFEIQRMSPDIAIEMPTGPATSHELQLDWEKWEQLNRSRTISIAVNHPKATRVVATVRGGAGSRPLDPRTTGSQIDQRMISAALNGNVEAVQSAIVAGASLEASDSRGATALVIAAKRKHDDMLTTLLEMGFDVHRGDDIGKTALMWAAHMKNVPMINALMEAGADVQQRDVIGMTALCYAAAFGDEHTIGRLIELGANVNSVNNVGQTPLHWAAGIGTPERVAALLEADPELEIQDMLDQGARPLTLAIRRGQLRSAELLVEAGADVDGADDRGITPLMWAAQGGNLDKIGLLLDHGASNDLTDNSGKTAADHAAMAPNSTEVLELLATTTARR